MPEVLGLAVAPLTVEETLDQIERWMDEGQPRWVVTLNPEMAMRAQDEPGFREMLNRADLSTADGVGIVWAVRRLEHLALERVSGVELMEGLLRRGATRNTRFYFLGGRPGVAGAARDRALALYMGVTVVGVDHGYFDASEEAAVVARIHESSPDVILVALGSPRQEEFIARNLHAFGRGVAIGVGGSLDVLAGVVKRAPHWVRRFGLEWAYRIVVYNRWRRALPLPRFAWRVLRSAERR